MSEGPPSSGLPSSDAVVDADPHAAFAHNLIGQRVGGRYLVERVLGMGGMGMVVEARYTELDQQVAIKIMFPEHASNGVLAARFIREAKVAAKVKSPHLVRVTDLGKLDSGVPYLVMEFLSGHDLDHELARDLLSAEHATDLILQALVGLAELHALGVVHRDLKPSNLFLTEIGGTPVVKILDYGISKDAMGVSSALTVTDSLIGTPTHMSPEQIKTPKDVDARSDIWAIGIIVYQLLTRKLPFDLEGGTVGELFGYITFSDAIPIRQRRPELSPALETVVMRCLKRDRAERFADVGALAEALRPFASANSASRIDSIKKALEGAPPAGRHAQPTSEGVVTVASGFARGKRVGDVVVPVQDAVETPAESLQPTKVESSGANAPRIDSRPVADSRSLATSSRSVLAKEVIEPKKSRTGVYVGLGVFALVAVTGVLYTNRSSPARETEPAASAPPPLNASSAAARSTTPATTASEIPTTITAPTETASAAPSSTPSPPASASARVTIAPRPRATGNRPATRPATPSAPTTKPDTLILDRK